MRTLLVLYNNCKRSIDRLFRVQLLCSDNSVIQLRSNTTQIFFRFGITTTANRCCEDMRTIIVNFEEKQPQLDMIIPESILPSKPLLPYRSFSFNLFAIVPTHLTGANATAIINVFHREFIQHYFNARINEPSSRWQRCIDTVDAFFFIYMLFYGIEISLSCLNSKGISLLHPL